MQYGQSRYIARHSSERLHVTIRQDKSLGATGYEGFAVKTEQEWKSVSDLVELYKNKMLVANPEYQRGAVWSLTHKRKLIDSVLRGYPLPLIYLHHIKKTVAGMQREDLEIIDGQQRITALYEFAEGSFSLFDPVKDDKQAKFPAFIKRQPCPWAGMLFSALAEDLQNQFLDTSLPIAKIETTEANEVRDLFVRLQSGLPLNAQETRDAWPGQYTEFVLAVGGKPELARYPGHAFFQGPMGLNPRTDRGKTRQFAAQISMLFLSHRERGSSMFPDINAPGINDFYFSNIDFERTCADAKRFIEILNKLSDLIGNGKRPKLKAHDAMHLILLVDSLWDDYTRSWERALPAALDRFLEGLASAKAKKDAENPDEFWIRYGQWTRVNSDRGERIAHRHAFYMEKMLEYLGPLQLKDPQRVFGELEREILFFKYHKLCAVCQAQIPWNEAQVHHVIEHSQGGQTLLTNAALVHKACHPKGEAATKAFAKQFLASRSLKARKLPETDYETAGYLWKNGNSRLFLPHGTDIRMAYRGQDYTARVEGNDIIYDGYTTTPGSLANSIAGSSRNAWRDLWIKFPDDETWELADDLRRKARSDNEVTLASLELE
jgi:hypothetical protein